MPPKEDKAVTLKDSNVIAGIEMKPLENNFKGQVKILSLLKEAEAKLAIGFNKTCLPLNIPFVPYLIME